MEAEKAGSSQTTETQDRAAKPVEDLLRRLGPKAVFGEPVQAGEVTVIPVAEVRLGFGFGFGSGRTTRSQASESEEGSGGGSGGAGKVVPRGYIRMAPEGTRFEPIIDPMRMAMMAFAFSGWLAFLLIRR